MKLMSRIPLQRLMFPLLLLTVGLALAPRSEGAWPGFEETGSLSQARAYHTATLLPNGKVLVAGGLDGGASAELYDPASRTWTTTGSLATGRSRHTATLLPNGKVLVAAGYNGEYYFGNALASAELYDPASGTWTATHSLANTHSSHTATLLPNGNVLVVSGDNNGVGYDFPGAELYDVSLGISNQWQPEIAIARLRYGHRLCLIGSRFQGISQAAGGNTQDSSTNYPIVQLRSLDSSQVMFLPVDPSVGWSNTTFSPLPVKGFPSGPALVTVFTNGIPSDAKSLIVRKRND